MEREKELEMTVAHVAAWLDGNDWFDRLKPVSASRASQIADVCRAVLGGDTLEQAIAKIKQGGSQ